MHEKIRFQSVKITGMLSAVLPCLFWVTAAPTLANTPRAAKATNARPTLVFVSDPEDVSQSSALLEYAIKEQLAASEKWTVLDISWGLSQIKFNEKLLSDVDKTLNLARTKFDNIQLDIALKLYTLAHADLERAAPSLEAVNKLIDTLVMGAACNLLMGKTAAARRQLKSVIALSPTYRPDEKVYNPTMMQVFESVQRENIKGLPGEVFISTHPDRAAVYLDGQFVGISPVGVKALPGRHYLAVVLKNYQIFARPLDVTRKSNPPLDISLIAPEAVSNTRIYAAASLGAIGQPILSEDGRAIQAKFQAKQTVLFMQRKDQYILARYGSNGTLMYINQKHATPPSSMAEAYNIAASLLAAPILSPKIATGSPRAPTIVEVAPPTHALRWVAYGTAGAFAVAGGTFAYLAAKDQQKFRSADQVAATQIATSAKRNALIADICFGLGAAALTTAVVIHITEALAERETTSTNPTESPKAQSELLIGLGQLGLKIGF
jgi:hypothetical protein